MKNFMDSMVSPSVPLFTTKMKSVREQRKRPKRMQPVQSSMIFVILAVVSWDSEVDVGSLKVGAMEMP